MGRPLRAAVAAALVSTTLLAPVGASAGDDARPAADPYDPPVRVPEAADPAVRVRHDLAGDLTLRTRGRVTYGLAVSGTLPQGASVPPRSLDGTVDLVRRVRLVGGVRTSTVEGPFVVTGRWGDAPPKTVTVPLTLTFEEGGSGAAVGRTVKFSAPGLAVDDLEVLQRAFTDRFGPPDRPVRVGDRFAPTEGMAVEESLLRVAFRLSQRELTGKAPLVPVPGGAVWVDALEGKGADAVLVVRAAITHALSTDTDAPKAPENVHVDYRAAVEGRRALVVDGGWAKAHDVALRRRLRYTGQGFDYTVEVEQRATLETTREPAR